MRRGVIGQPVSWPVTVSQEPPPAEGSDRGLTRAETASSGVLALAQAAGEVLNESKRAAAIRPAMSDLILAACIAFPPRIRRGAPDYDTGTYAYKSSRHCHGAM